MKEKYQHDPVHTNGFDGKAIKALIDFMYSGEVTIDNENVMDLFATSNYLQVDEVKQIFFFHILYLFYFVPFDFFEPILSSYDWFAVNSVANLIKMNICKIKFLNTLARSLMLLLKLDKFK